MCEIQKISRRTVYGNRWMKVHEDAVRFSNGSEGIYGVVDKDDFALIVPLHEDGRFQLVQQYRYPVGARYWEFPQGSWETNPEVDPEELALGELQEETGFHAGSLTKLGHLFEAYGFSNQGFHVFLATQLKAGNVMRDNEEQDMQTAAFSRNEVNEMIQSGQIKDAPTIAALGLFALSDF